MSRRTGSTRSAATATTSHTTTSSHTTTTTTPSQPRPPPPKQTPKLGSRTLVVDPGAYTIKAGFATDSPNPQKDCHIIPNCLAKSPRDDKTYIGSQLQTCLDYGEMQFRRPVQKGYIVNWPTESCIFDHEFFSDPSAPLYCDPHDTNLIISEAPNSPLALQRNIDEIVFEAWEFTSAFRTTAPILNAWTDTRALFGDAPLADHTPLQPAECLLVIDCGHSHTTITPLLHGRPIHPACRRVPLAGKHISNYLAELISLRHFSLMDEPHIVDQLKQDACFVSPDFNADLEACWKGTIGSSVGHNHAKRKTRRDAVVVDYVLPDYDTLHRGYILPHVDDNSHAAKLARLGLSSTVSTTTATPKQDILPLSNERFTPPHLLFQPSLISHPTASLPATILHSLESIPPPLHAPFLANILLTGGTALIPGFKEQLEREIRAGVDAGVEVRVEVAREAVKGAWWGGARMCAREGGVGGICVGREEYLENGAGWVARKFAGTRV